MINIKITNYWPLHDDFVLNGNSRIVGDKLIALNRLIKYKGTLLNLGNNIQMKGIEISEGKFIGMEITHFDKKNFFPCKIKKFHLQKLN
jgi:hypothetical protein